jgi:CDP-glucose 4,6-dehydratase
VEGLGLSTDAAFFAGKRVFVTGHTGFKGAWLTLWLRNAGATVTGYALPPPSDPSLFDRARVGEGITSIEGDVREIGALEKAVRGAEPEIVLHLAAQSLVRPSYEDPVGTFATNVMGTVNVLDVVRRTPSARAVVIVTSDKCYANDEQGRAYREGDPMGGHDPYSASKGAAEIVAASYRASFFDAGAAIATVRAGNVIGGGDWARDRLIPDAIRAFERGERLRVRNPRATRPWQHVLEPLRGYMHIARKLWAAPREHAEAWNFGPDDASTERVASVVDAVAAAWGGGAAWEVPEGAEPHEAMSLRLDCGKARARLGWKPALDLARAIEWTVDLYRRVGAGEDARATTLAQIARYETLP